MKNIVVPLFLVLIMTTLCAVKVKSFKIHLLIDGILLTLMFVVVILRRFAVCTVVCLDILLLWTAIGAIARRNYFKFDFWIMNKMCKLFKMPQYKSVEEVDVDSTHSIDFQQSYIITHLKWEYV